MTDTHIPVVPNIGAHKKTKRSIFENDAEDVPPLSRKKIDILDIETQKTDEETAAKKEGGSISWILIVLIIVIIILLIAIIFYVFSKNSNRGDAIHPEIVRPMTFATAQHVHRMTNNQEPAQNTQSNGPARHQLYVEPTKEELNATLSRAQGAKELNDEETQEIISSPIDDAKPKHDDDSNVINITEIDENIESLIYEDEFNNDGT